ncbi:ATP-dependent 6-phosphofructokinase [Desulfohalovibrio reitneri]|uniref:ATP-dependent 6-phosphofructokinase n=1 Tax=Desulfohalovibrio reitneri TaxID=1307759 RepID=UPI00055620E0|nr:ATP-dependent 6-phosphofructokinase [Desulfohalovibrio reitneri]
MSQENICVPDHSPPSDTAIETLGRAKIETPLGAGRYISDGERILVYVNMAVRSELKDGRNATLELAGPRDRIYFDPAKTKAAVVTCGGLCPGINDVIRSMVLEAHHNYDIAGFYGVRYGLEGFNPDHGHELMELTPDNVTHIHEFGGTILGSSRGPQPMEVIVDFLERHNIGVLFMIGGDGTMHAASALVEEIKRRNIKIGVIGVPKTIDNDINFVANTFGFDTAVEKATVAIRCAHTEALGVPNGIGLVKVMGRQAGFIAAQSALALRDVDFVLVPEDEFEISGPHGFLTALHRRLKKRGHAVVVVAEGAGQHLLPESGETDPSGNIKLGDITGLLRKEIDQYMQKAGLDYTLKYIDPSYMVRSVPANSNDGIYCGFLGQNAVHAAMAGKTAMVVSKWNGHYVHMPLGLVTRGRKRIDTCSNYWRSVLESTGQHVYYQPDE